MSLPVLTYVHICPPGCEAGGERIRIRPVTHGTWYEMPAQPVCVFTNADLVLEKAEAETEDEAADRAAAFPLSLPEEP